jgi:hypothetical protein
MAEEELRSPEHKRKPPLRSANPVKGLSSPLLCAPARRPAHLLGCSTSPRLAACLAACFGAPLDSTSVSPAPESLSPQALGVHPIRCTSGAGGDTGGVPTRGTSQHWGHPLRVERAAGQGAGCFVGYDACTNLGKHRVVCGFSWLLRVTDREAVLMEPKAGVVLFTTTLRLYGGVLWSGELQGFIIHEMMPTTTTTHSSRQPRGHS